MSGKIARTELREILAKHITIRGTEQDLVIAAMADAVARFGAPVVDDAMVGRARRASQKCEASAIERSPPWHMSVNARCWTYRGKEFATFDEAKDAQQREIMRAALVAALEGER